MERPLYFTKHLFKTGMVCPVKLFYKAKGYPENKQGTPFIRHAVFNKRLLKSLARSRFPDGKYIEAETVADAAKRTKQELTSDSVVLFDAVFEHQQMMARLPIIERKGERLRVIQIQTRAFRSNHPSLMNKQGQIHPKWRDYLLNFAYQLYIIDQCVPHLKLDPRLLLPNKSGTTKMDQLPRLLMDAFRLSVPPDIPGENLEILTELDVGEEVSMIWNDHDFAGRFLPKDTFEDSLQFLRQTFFKKSKVDPPIGGKCKNCEFRLEKQRAREGVRSGFTECWSPHTEADNGSGRHVFDLIGPGTEQWIQREVYDQRRIPDKDIMKLEDLKVNEGRINQTMRQALQIHQSKGRKVPAEMIQPALHEELQRWTFPLHFIDFEAANYAVPPRAQRRPYQLLVFQYSCHTLQEDGSWQHHQWLHDTSAGYTNYELVRQLLKLPDITKGTIVQYSNFERNALKLIRRELLNEHHSVAGAGELTAWIEHILQRRDSTHHKPPFIADLSRQVKYYYYNHQMRNSLSIKDVLHAIMKDSAFLKQQYSSPYSSRNFKEMIWWQTNEQGDVLSPYQLLTQLDPEGVRRGTEAMVTYGKLITDDLSKDQRAENRKALFRYCELDTLAMMMIFQHWQHVLQIETD